MKKGKGSLKRFRGVMLAEAAIVMTLLCMVTLGALQYGWFFYCLHTATNAARQGARVACVLGAQVPKDGEDAIKSALGGEDALLYKAADPRTVTPITVDGRDAIQGIVEISLDTARLMPIEWFPVPVCRATVTMAKEGG